MSYDLGTAHGKIELSYDGDRAIDRAEKDIDKLQTKAKTSDGELKKLGNTLKGLGKGLGKGVALTGLVASLTNAAVQAGALTIQILGMVPALVSIVSLSAALPGIYAALYITMGVLKAALSGVGEAIKLAFDPEKAAQFEKALEKLSPAARDFAVAVKESAPAFKDLQQSIQEAFFSNNLQAFIPRIVAGLNSMRPTLTGLAADFGGLAKEILRLTVDTDDTWEFLDSAAISFREQLAKLKPALEPLITGLREAGTVGLSLMDRLGTSVANVANRFGEWLSEIAGDGRLTGWIDKALLTLNQLGTLVGNVGRILTSVFSAAESTGGGLLGMLAQITGEAARFLESAEGSAALTSIFSAILEVAKQLAPIFTTLAGSLLSALAPALAQIATTIGPVLLQVVQALAPAFGPLAQGIADVMTAIAPLIPPIAALAGILAGALGSALTAISSEIGPLAELFGGVLLQAVQMLAPVFAQLAASALPLAASLGQQLLTALAPLAPVILQLAQAFVDSLLPALPQLTEAFAALIPSIVQLATIFAGSLVGAIQAILPYLPQIVSAFVALAVAMPQLIGFFLQMTTVTLAFASAVGGAIFGVINWFAQLPVRIGGALNAAYSFVLGVGSAIAAWFSAIPGRIGAALAALPGIVSSTFRRALELAATAVGYGAGIVVGIAVKIPQRIIAAVASLPGLLSSWASRAWNAASAAFNAGVNAAVGFARNLVPRTRSAVSSLGSTISNLASSAWNSLKSRFSAGVSQAVSIAQGLPGRVRGALGNLGGILYSAGSAIIQGLINGISSGIGRVTSMVSSLASRVSGAFSSALKIFSPSKVFYKFGVNIDQGVINGIRSKLADVVQMSKILANSVIRPAMKPFESVQGIVQQAAINSVPRLAAAEAGIEAASFGPYHLEVDGQAIASIVIDTVTGNPTVISSATREGARQDDWAGTGRRGRASR